MNNKGGTLCCHWGICCCVWLVTKSNLTSHFLAGWIHYNHENVTIGNMMNHCGPQRSIFGAAYWHANSVLTVCEDTAESPRTAYYKEQNVSRSFVWRSGCHNARWLYWGTFLYDITYNKAPWIAPMAGTVLCFQDGHLKVILLAGVKPVALLISSAAQIEQRCCTDGNPTP